MRLFLLAAIVFFARGGALRAAEAGETLLLSHPRGASFSFTATESGWQWTGFAAPGAIEPRRIEEQERRIVTGSGEEMLGANWTLVSAGPERMEFEQEAPFSGMVFRRVFLFGAAAHALRIETWVRSTERERTLRRFDALAARFVDDSFRETGAAPASFPLFGAATFVGLEHVSGEARAEGDRVRVSQAPWRKVDAEWQRIATVVVGWVPLDQRALFPGESAVREAFLQYLDTVRVKPERIEFHTNTWWTLPLPFSEAEVLRDIDALRAGLTERTGLFFDSYALDLGWSNPKSVWRADAGRFPNEFRTINEKLGSLGARLGLWISPGSAYPPGLDNAWLRAQGYEVSAAPGRPAGVACFALGGRYQQAVKESITNYARQYALGHVKLDFMAPLCDDATHGHPPGADSAFAVAAGLADVLDALRAIDPRMALEPLCCGYPPSPWWTMHTPFVMGPAGDDLPPGRVACPEWMESLITARDIAYRAAQQDWLMPTQALETFDIIVQSPGEFENMAVMAAGRGRWFLSTYLKPELMKAEDWDFLAALVRWQRENKRHLVNALPIGGRPEQRQAYGYHFPNRERDLYCVRNPWIEERTMALPMNATEARELRMIYPRRATLARIEPGAEPPAIAVAPYETIFLETVPAGETTEVSPRPEPRAATFAAGPLLQLHAAAGRAPGSVHYAWDAVLAVPEIAGAELCVLIDGATQVSGATARIWIDREEVAVRRVSSEGQFSASLEPGPEHWTWMIAALTPGEHVFQIELSAPVEHANLGVFLRGTTAAANDPAPESGAVFPVFRAGRRAWSQTLLPLQPIEGKEASDPR